MKCSLLWALVLVAATSYADFSVTWLQDESYWGDGKAEFNIYQARELRYGQPRDCELIHIVVREPFSPREVVKTENGAQPGAYAVLKLNQILHVPTGVYVYQQMHSAFWSVKTGELIKATLTSNDSCGNTYKEFRALFGPRRWFGRGWSYEWRTYWEGMSAGEETIRAPRNAIFQDELPARVRMIDFTRGDQGEFEIALAPTIIKSKKDEVKFVPAKVRWRRAKEEWQVAVTGEKGIDQFTLERQSPYRLKRWARADGSSATLLHSIKIDYWNYNKPGDKERALNRAADHRGQDGRESQEGAEQK